MPNTLNDSPAVIVARLLQDLGLAAVPAYAVAQDGSVTYSGQPWPSFSTSEPDFPDECVTVYDQQGIDSGRFQYSGKLQSFYGIQVRVRSLTHDSGWSKADAIRKAMAESVYERTVTLGSNVYVVGNFNNLKQVLSLGKDAPDTKRSLFTVNATALINMIPITS